MFYQQMVYVQNNPLEASLVENEKIIYIAAQEIFCLVKLSYVI